MGQTEGLKLHWRSTAGPGAHAHWLRGRKLPRRVSPSWILQDDAGWGAKSLGDWRERLEDGESAHADGLEKLIIENDLSTKSNLQIRCHPTPDSRVTLQRQKSNLKMHVVWLFCLFVSTVGSSSREDTLFISDFVNFLEILPESERSVRKYHTSITTRCPGSSLCAHI